MNEAYLAGAAPAMAGASAAQLGLTLGFIYACYHVLIGIKKMKAGESKLSDRVVIVYMILAFPIRWLLSGFLFAWLIGLLLVL